MRKIIFDTTVFDLIYNDILPEKWRRYWQEIRNNNRELILFEILISEIFYRLSQEYGFEPIQNKIYQIKSLKSSKLIIIDDRIAISSGKIKNKYRGLSIVDSFILALSNHLNAKIVTTDHGIRDASKGEKIKVDFLPWEEVRKLKP